MLTAVTVATACVLEGSVAQEGESRTVSVEHSTGEFGVELGMDPADPKRVAVPRCCAPHGSSCAVKY